MGNTDKPVALVIGAGDHLGGAIARRFAREGFHLVVTRRRGDLQALSTEITALGSSATTIHSDARDEDQVSELIERVESELGPIRVAVFNVGGNVQFDVCDTTARIYRKVWEMCALAGFLVGREVAKKMLPRSEGTILFTGASASLRGGRGFAAFAGGKHALRALAQSMAREMGPQGIHVGHVIVDGLIRNEATAEFLPDLYASKGEGGIIEPDDLAEIYWQLHKQPRSAWTFEQDARPFSESW
ncbi:MULTISPECIES: SDR family NAD(P)-dependent oxidoreductase [unclassified Marinobacter]|uniref:SDR family NAD(P)-dependent oxidoreductase n=1 Tax=unclassified Marinobacter TaxID=83889 RepID=UPI0026E43F3D|nr:MULTISPECIES: SDR family NAD(P)-dependent oxidoreductase [unclassified Marinobacter]MDO6442306.1 SDR family NAD(P)-dependent oxidoreductase [Marinobacter sp. 2_MG-2023]MDO6824924.1 SDR family NAD(P)-dependent oxidoreductase [Marinobacter sp. 1_MG-2023]